MTSPFDARPIVVAVAGPNGAGKSTFFAAHLQPAGLRFVNADEIGRELGVGAYEAAEAASHIRQALLEQRESFVFETVFSDPAGGKLGFLLQAEKKGYAVILCFVGLDGPGQSEERVAMRVLQGGSHGKLRGSADEEASTYGFPGAGLRQRGPGPAVPPRGDVRARGAGREVAPLPRWFPRG